MVVHRTKACAACRRRRIKCDETLPECLMCVRFGRTCPGPSEGPNIVLITANTISKGRKARSEPSAFKASNPAPTPIQTPSAADSITRFVQYVQPSTLPLYSQVFLSRFLSFFTTPTSPGYRRSWMHQVLELQIDKFHVLDLSFRATSMAFCGQETGRYEIMRQSYTVYGKALQAVSKSLQDPRFTSPGIVKDSSEWATQVLCATILLSFYEAFQSLHTQPEGYCKHIQGARNMLELVKADLGNAQSVVNPLFFALRVHVLSSSLINGEPTRLATQKYLDISYMGQPQQPVSERLVSLLLILLDIYNGNPLPDTLTIGSLLLEINNPSSLLTSLETLWQEFQHVNNLDLDPSPKSPPNTLVATNSSSKETRTQAPAPPVLLYYISCFDTARLLLSVILTRHCQSQSTSTSYNASPESTTALSMDAYIQMCCSSILAYVLLIQGQRIGCAYVRAIMPLYLVARYSPCPRQREQAYGVFGRWQRGNVVPGLCTLALQKLADECSGDGGGSNDSSTSTSILDTGDGGGGVVLGVSSSHPMANYTQTRSLDSIRAA